MGDLGNLMVMLKAYPYVLDVPQGLQRLLLEFTVKENTWP